MNIKAIITVDSEIMGGQPVFTGTRVPVVSLFDHLEAGVSLDETVGKSSANKYVYVLSIGCVGRYITRTMFI